MEPLILSIDLSTTCTGWAVYKASNSELIASGRIKGKNFKDSSKIRAILRKLEFMATEIMTVLENYMPSHVVIEEISGSSNRLGQKTLDMQHGILIKHLEPYLDMVSFYDSDGNSGWRTHLGLRLSVEDKEHNKTARKLNKTMLKGTPLIPIINYKHLSCRFANETLGTTFDVDKVKSDADEADAVSMGYAFCQKLTKSKN